MKKPVKRAKGAKKKATSKRRPVKKTARRRATSKRRRPRGANQELAVVAFEPEGLRARSGGQSGDLQGLSGVETAGGESVDELIEEGNAFEAEAVQGVQDAADPDEHEVAARETSEDDVPDEYLDQDQ
jgi:hypothetical protein